jgi:hypothetical protein
LKTDERLICRAETTWGSVCAATRADVDANAAWASAMAGALSHVRKDARYYGIVEQTIRQGFDYLYLVMEDKGGAVRAIQPAFVLDQDLLQGAGPIPRAMVRPIRGVFSGFLKMRTLMVGCAAGEGHLPSADEQERQWIAANLHHAMPKVAKAVGASMIVMKEFPSTYRSSMRCFSDNGYARIPSLPMVRLSIDYANFDDYAQRALSKVTRKSLRRKLRHAAEGPAIQMQVVNDLTPFVEEAYPLYQNVLGRSKMQFEILTREYLCRLGQEMSDKVRFMLWRREGRLVAFSVCMVQGDTLYDEYLGLDYSIALDLHLYFVTLRDILEWGMNNGYKWYVSSALNYDPKLHLKCDLAPLDLYVTHRSAIANFVLRRILPWVAPTNGDKVLPKFRNHAELWGEQ